MSRLPIIISASSSLIEATRPPQVEQKLLPAYVPVIPEICSMASRGHIANAAKAEPLVLRAVCTVANADQQRLAGYAKGHAAANTATSSNLRALSQPLGTSCPLNGAKGQTFACFMA